MLALSLISFTLAAATQLPELHSRLQTSALTPPTISASCKGSAGALGTGNTFGNGRGTSIINIWVISDSRRNIRIGWIEKTADDRLWYEDPVGLTRVITEEWRTDVFETGFSVHGMFFKGPRLTQALIARAEGADTSTEYAQRTHVSRKHVILSLRFSRGIDVER